MDKIKIISLLLLLGACSNPGHHKDSLITKLEADGTTAVRYEISAEQYTADIKKVPFINTTNDTLFFIPERTGRIESFPCNKCHNVPLTKMVSDDPTGKKAHWQIRLEHADHKIMDCATCHNSDNLEYLQAQNHRSISFNNSYDVCRQCHSTQYNDWLGGAHGKNISVWLPPRLAKNCVDCHNPHSPGLEKRWPARLNTVKIQELDPR